MFFRKSNLSVRIFGNIVIFLLIAYSLLASSGFLTNFTRNEFIHLNSQPVILNPETLNIIDEVARGQGIVIQYDITKEENGCFAEYQHVFNGPVSFSITTGKSRNVKERGSKSVFQLRTFIELPKTVPTGIYTIQLVVYPTCDGIDRDPFPAIDKPLTLLILN